MYVLAGRGGTQKQYRNAKQGKWESAEVQKSAKRFFYRYSCKTVFLFQMTQLSRKEKKNLSVHLSYEDKVPSKTNMY